VRSKVKVGKVKVGVLFLLSESGCPFPTFLFLLFSFSYFLLLAIPPTGQNLAAAAGCDRDLRGQRRKSVARGTSLGWICFVGLNPLAISKNIA